MPRTSVREQLLEIPLRLAVRIHRPLRRVLGNGNRRRVPVHRAGGRENETADPGANRCLQQYTGGRHIVGHILLRLRNRLGHERERGQVDDGRDAFPLEQCVEQLAISHISLDQAGPPSHGLAVAGAQVVEYDHRMPSVEELIYDDTADVPCSARDEDP